MEQGRLTGEDLWTSFLDEHVNSTAYKAGMGLFHLMAGYRAGVLGLDMEQMGDYQKGLYAGMKAASAEAKRTGRKKFL